jgi:uncharacterized protein (TIRG00374 family)
VAKPLARVLLNLLKYSVALGVAGFLLWYVYRDIPLSDIVSRFQDLHHEWLILSVVVAFISHWLRAYRWNILLEPLGYQLNSWRTFLAVMVGYFANLLLPRMGEITRCGVLKKMDNVSMTSSFGTVVAERLIDLLTLLALVLFTFFVEFDKLNDFVLSNFGGKAGQWLGNIDFYIILLIIGLAGLLTLVFIYRVYRHTLRKYSFYQKVAGFVAQLLTGFLSIRKIKNKTGFWLSTLGIWLLYYLIPFVVFYALPETSGLTPLAGLAILVMSGIGMSAPVQGGIGVFHILVSRILILYGISQQDGEFFALILHTTHFFTVLIFGGLCYVISLFLKPKDSQTNEYQRENTAH